MCVEREIGGVYALRGEEGGVCGLERQLGKCDAYFLPIQFRGPTWNG